MIHRPQLRVAVATFLASVAVGLAVPFSAAAAPADVNIVDNAFEPSAVTIAVGETVTFRWVGQNSHGVTGPWGTHPQGCSFATSFNCKSAGDDPFVFQANQAGTFAFNCPVHAEMTGTLTVVDPAAQPTPTGDPTASPSPSQSSPAGSPSPTTSPSPSSPNPSSRPTQEPSEPRFTVGPPPERETEPPVVVEGSAGPIPTEQVTLEPFPDAPDPDQAIASEQAAERGEQVALQQQQRRTTVPRVVSVGLVLGTLIAFVQFVLLGPEWVTGD